MATGWKKVLAMIRRFPVQICEELSILDGYTCGKEWNRLCLVTKTVMWPHNIAFVGAGELSCKPDGWMKVVDLFPESLKFWN